MSSGLTCTDLCKLQDCENQAKEEQKVQVTDIDNKEDSEDNSGEDGEEDNQKIATTI